MLIIRVVLVVHVQVSHAQRAFVVLIVTGMRIAQAAALAHAVLERIAACGRLATVPCQELLYISVYATPTTMTPMRPKVIVLVAARSGIWEEAGTAQGNRV